MKAWEEFKVEARELAQRSGIPGQEAIARALHAAYLLGRGEAAKELTGPAAWAHAVVGGMDVALTGSDYTGTILAETMPDGTMRVLSSDMWTGQEVKLLDGHGGYVVVDLALLKGAELDAFAEQHAVMSRVALQKAADETAPRAAPHALMADDAYRYVVVQALRQDYVYAQRRLKGR